MPPPHYTDDVLELYLLNLVEESLKEQIEEHLLGCSLCIGAVEQLEKHLALMRRGMQAEILDAHKKALMAKLDAGEIPIFKLYVN